MAKIDKEDLWLILWSVFWPVSELFGRPEKAGEIRGISHFCHIILAALIISGTVCFLIWITAKIYFEEL